MKTNIEDRGKSGIYLIKNLINNKIYIGKAKCIYKRIKQHITSLNKEVRSHENDHLINAWKKYERENFNYIVLEYLVLDEKLISSKEIYYIDLYESLNPKKGYNKRYDSSTGLIVSIETRNKMRESRYKALENPEIRSKYSHSFWKDNPEELKKMSKKITEINRKYKIGKFTYNSKEELIEVFNSKEEIKEKYPNFYIQAIMGCCQGTKKSYKNYKWKYISIETGEIIHRNYDYKPKNKQLIT